MPADTTTTSQHQWIQHTTNKGSRSMARRIVLAWYNYFSDSGAPTSLSKIQKINRITVKWRTNDGVPQERSIRFEELVEVVVNTCDFSTNSLGLPWITSKMYGDDPDFQASDFSPITDHTGTLQLKYIGSMGPAFPLRPCLDRSGVQIYSFDNALYDNIVHLHENLISDSINILNDVKWFHSLRFLFNDIVSVVDITLTKLYLLAEYNPKPEWHFDRERLGARAPRRMKDKLQWVQQITGRPLNAREGREAFDCLRKIRNHFNHFDPPCVVYSVDDVALWLNLVPKVGELLWAIQDCMGEPLKQNLVRVLMLRSVRVMPKNPQKERPPQLPTAGYASSDWPKDQSDF